MNEEVEIGDEHEISVVIFTRSNLQTLLSWPIISENKEDTSTAFPVQPNDCLSICYEKIIYDLTAATHRRT